MVAECDDENGGGRGITNCVGVGSDHEKGRRDGINAKRLHKWIKNE